MTSPALFDMPRPYLGAREIACDLPVNVDLVLSTYVTGIVETMSLQDDVTQVVKMEDQICCYGVRPRTPNVKIMDGSKYEVRD